MPVLFPADISAGLFFLVFVVLQAGLWLAWGALGYVWTNLTGPASWKHGAVGAGFFGCLLVLLVLSQQPAWAVAIQTLEGVV